MCIQAKTISPFKYIVEVLVKFQYTIFDVRFNIANVELDAIVKTFVFRSE